MEKVANLVMNERQAALIVDLVQVGQAVLTLDAGLIRNATEKLHSAYQNNQYSVDEVIWSNEKMGDIVKVFRHNSN